MRPEKPTIVKQIQSQLDASSHFIMISYMGLTVKKQEELKSQLRAKGVKLQVHKNQLLHKASAGKPYAKLADIALTGGTAVAFGTGEAPETAKVIKAFAKDNDKVKFKVAYFEGQIFEGKAAEGVADMLTKDGARAHLLRTLLEAPASLVRVLHAHAEKNSSNNAVIGD